MAVVRKSKKNVASRKSRRGKNRKLPARREKAAAKSKRNFYRIKFPRSSYLTSCPLVRWYFSQKMRDNRLSLQKGKHPTGLGSSHRKTSMQVDNRKRSRRVDNRKKSVRVDNQKKSVRVDKRKKPVRVDKRKKPVRVDNQKKAVRADNRKASVRGGKQKRTPRAKLTCPKVMQAVLQEVARKKQAKWVVTGMKKRKRSSNKESCYKLVKPAARKEADGSSSSLDPGFQDRGANASDMMSLPTASELQEVSS